jgi:hypothetical protein
MEQARDKWRALWKKVMNRPIQQNAANVLSSRKIISCTTRTSLFATTELWAYKEENKLEETFRDFCFFSFATETEKFWNFVNWIL